MLFACGTFAALGRLSLPTLLAVFISAAFLGDAANYAVGAFFGARAVDAGLIKREFVAKTEAFYAKHGPRTVVLARFVPIVRTFAPFVAGVADMPYPTFSAYNAGGAVLWSVSLTLAGAAFGRARAGAGRSAQSGQPQSPSRARPGGFLFKVALQAATRLQPRSVTAWRPRLHCPRRSRPPAARPTLPTPGAAGTPPQCPERRRRSCP